MERIAIIELSQYQLKLTIANIVNDSFVVISSQSQNLKLWIKGVDECFLKKPQIEEVVGHLKHFRRFCDYYKVQKTYSYAFFFGGNKPKNLFSFFDEVFATSGFRFVAPSIDEIAYSAYSSAINTLDCPKAYLLEIEADHILLLHYNRRTIVDFSVLDFSPISLLEKFSIADFDSSQDRFNEIYKFAKSKISKLQILQEPEPSISFVGAGQPIIDLCQMVKKLKKYPLDLTHAYVTNQSDINIITGQISQMELDKSKVIKGLNGGRADIFCCALLIQKAVAESLGINEFNISQYSITEGLLFAIASPSTMEKPNSDCLGQSLLTQMVCYDLENAKHNEQVYNLAMLLYKQLKVLHKLPRGYIKILRAAAMLHDSGKRVNAIDHAKHSYYVILYSELYGLSHREKLLAAYVASLHEGGEISLADWISKKELVSEEDLIAVKKLGVILQLAEYFDVSRTNAIIDISCDVLGDSVIMKTFTESDNSFEIQESAKINKVFEKYFKKRLEVL